MALTLRAVGGLTSEEIARAFLVPVPTIQARITRAKKTIAAAGVPFAVAHGPLPALALVDDLVATDRLAGSHLLPTVRGELLTRLGRTAEARTELELAARLCRNARERAVLLRKADALG